MGLCLFILCQYFRVFTLNRHHYDFFSVWCYSAAWSFFGWNTWLASYQTVYGAVYAYTPKVNTPIRNLTDHALPKRAQQYHPFHIVSYSPWPLAVSVAVLCLVGGLLSWFSTSSTWAVELSLAVFLLGVAVWGWWVDVVNESLTEHTVEIKWGLGAGMILFIVSEIMFFFSFFWAFFHVSLAPAIELGCVWPPKGLELLVISPFGAPLLNTLILVVSGITLTCAHHAYLRYAALHRALAQFCNLLGNLLALHSAVRHVRMFTAMFPGFLSKSLTKYHVTTTLIMLLNRYRILFYSIITGYSPVFYYLSYVVVYFVFTLILAALFTVSQAQEYYESLISISDGVYGSTFFLMTGFHGFHVLVGTLFLGVCFVRILTSRVSFVRSVGLDCAVWYWHFVDVVWLLLFLFLYIWGNGNYAVIQLTDVVAVTADFSANCQVNFQDSADVLMEGIIDLHDYIAFYLCVVLGLVVWLLSTLVLEDQHLADWINAAVPFLPNLLAVWVRSPLYFS